jgi:hypothetical protein
VLLPATVLVVVALAIVVRRVGGTRSATGVERVYVVLAPLPLALAIVIPLVINLAFGFGKAPRRVVHGLNWAAIALSLGLTLAGLALVGRAMARGERWGSPLGVTVVVAGTPVVLVALSYGLFWLAARL